MQILNSRQKRKAAHNSGFALWGLKSFAETFVQGSTFVLRMNSSAKNPPQRKALKRYRQANMTTKITITLTLLLTIFLTACGQTKSKSTNEKKPFDFDRIDRIEISKHSTPPDTTNFDLKVLTKEQVKSFSDKWNQADKSELRKYLPSYNLTVYLKSGATRHFRIGGKYIKESDDYCFDFGDDNYFSNLYSNAVVSKVTTDSMLKTGWYYVTDQQTNFKRQLDKTSEFYFIDPNVIVPIGQFTKLELADSEYEGKSYPMLVIRFDTKGTDSWSIAIEKQIGGKLALIVNDKLVIAPKVNSRISAGVSALNRTDYTKQDIDEILKQIENERQVK